MRKEMRGTQMAMRRKEMAMRLVFALAMAAVAVPVCAGDAGAQPPADRTLLVEDSLPLPADTVRLTLRRYGGPEFCDVVHGRVVRDSADVAWLGRWSQCAHADFGNLREHSLVRVVMMGDCLAHFRIDGWKSASRREYRLQVTQRYGGCRAGGIREVWIAVPALPEGWRVRLSEVDLPDSESRREWPYARSIPETPGSISVLPRS